MKSLCFAQELPAPAPRPPAPVVMRPAPGVVEGTQRALCAGSQGRREALVLWAGRPMSASTVLISHVLLPLFESGPRHLVVPQAERLVVAQYLRRERLLAFADLHTHPFEAFLSVADEAAPYSSRDGFLAIVIPSFGTEPPGRGWRFYQVTAGLWNEVPSHEVVDGWTH